MADRDARSRPFRSLVDLFRRTPQPQTPAALTPDYTVPDDTLMKQAYLQYGLPRRDIETVLEDPADAQRFIDRVIAQWHALGEADPFWSNDTRDEFKKENIDDTRIREFYDDGEGVARSIAAFESRSGVTIKNGVCVELGCGVGKHTHVLARRFEHVIAIDVSSGGLAVCDAQMKKFGLTNVTTKLLTSPDDVGTGGETDFFFSDAVLQHNPPPIQKLLLDHALASLRPSGFCLFQTPDWIADYTFSAKRFLDEPAIFDLHCIPKTDVLAILDDNRMKLLDFAPDFAIGTFGSYTYFARKLAR